MSSAKSSTRYVLCAVFFLSGAAALIFETLWFRQAGLMLGNSVWATTVVLASFMAGLALGNALSARYADRLSRPVRSYAVLELIIAFTGITLVLVMPMLNSAIAPMLRPFLDQPQLLNPIRLAIAFAMLIVPSTAMGATLPLLVKGMCSRQSGFGSALGMLYGFNTLGAVAGALAGEFMLIKAIGVNGSAMAAGTVNVIAAGIAISIDRGESDTTDIAAIHIKLNGESKRLLVSALICGGALLALEVVWFRFMLLFTLGTSMVFAIMLAVVLAGIGLGGLTAGLWSRSSSAHYFTAIGALLSGVLVVGTYILFTFVGSTEYSNDLDPNLARAIRLMLGVSWLSGMLFTLIGQRLHTQINAASRAAGLVTLANTIGAMIGAILGGFVLLAKLGMEKSFFVIALAYGAVALLLAWDQCSRYTQIVKAAIFSAVFLYAVLIGMFPFGLMENRVFPLVVEKFTENDEKIIASREGLMETIFYSQAQTLGVPSHFRLITNGYSMSGSGTQARRYMKAFVYLPVALHPKPEKALLISYGVGSTAKALTDTSWLNHIDMVDISSDVLDMNSEVFPNPKDNPLNDPRVNVHIEDGRFFLQTTDQQYDLITGEPPPPKAAGIGNLYSREYFQLMYDRLAPGGMASYWLPIYQLTESDSRAILRAFADVFDDCSLWTGADMEWIMLGVRGGGQRTSEKQFQRQWDDPVIGPEIRALGFELPAELGSFFIADRSIIDQLTSDSLPLTDNYPLRLSPHDVITVESRYTDLMELNSAHQRFATSQYIARLWPRQLLDESSHYFQYRYLLHDVMSDIKIGPQVLPHASQHKVLAGSELRTLVLWLYQSDEDEQRIIDRLLKVRQPDGLINFKLAARAMADRRYDDAAKLFSMVREVSPQEVFIVYDELFALCMAGKLDDANSLARQIKPPHAPAEYRDVWWQFVEKTFGLKRPSS